MATQVRARRQIDQRISETQKELTYWKDVSKHSKGDIFLKNYIHEKYIVPLKMKLEIDTKISTALSRQIRQRYTNTTSNTKKSIK